MMLIKFYQIVKKSLNMIDLGMQLLKELAEQVVDSEALEAALEALEILKTLEIYSRHFLVVEDKVEVEEELPPQAVMAAAVPRTAAPFRKLRREIFFMVLSLL